MTLNRRWTDKLQRECLHNALLPSGVRATQTGEEVQLESSEQNDISRAVNGIKEFVVNQLMCPDSRFQTESVGSNKLAKTAHVSTKRDQETDENHKEKDASVKEKKTLNAIDKEHGHIGLHTAEDENEKTVNCRKEFSQKENKKEHNEIPEHEQRLVAGWQRTRTHRLRSREDTEPVDGDYTHNRTASVNSQAETAAEFAQIKADDEQGMDEAKTRDTEACESLHATGIRKQSKSFQINASDNISSDDDVSTASGEVKHKKYQTDEHLWAYIQFIDPASKWAEKLSPTLDTKQDDQMVELTGTSTDVDNLKKLCDASRLQRAVTSTMQRVPDQCTAKAFQNDVKMLSKNKVLVRLSNDPHYCDLVGKKSDIAELKNAIHRRYPGLMETEKMPDSQQPATSNKPPSMGQATSSINNSPAELKTPYSRGITPPPSLLSSPSSSSAAAGNSLSLGLGQVPPRMTQQELDAEFRFQTQLARLRVKIVTGDLVSWRCEVLVDSCDSDLSHAGGIARLFSIAAGDSMQAECNKYKRERGCLPQCGVMDTTAGNIQSPVRRIIHACGPSSRSYRRPTQDECASMLKMTFFNCFLYANDMLRVASIALPAISSGTFRRS